MAEVLRTYLSKVRAGLLLMTAGLATDLKFDAIRDQLAQTLCYDDLDCYA